MPTKLVESAPETGDLVVSIPQVLLDEGWRPGDLITWTTTMPGLFELVNLSYMQRRHDETDQKNI